MTQVATLHNVSQHLAARGIREHGRRGKQLATPDGQWQNFRLYRESWDAGGMHARVKDIRRVVHSQSVDARLNLVQTDVNSFSVKGEKNNDRPCTTHSSTEREMHFHARRASWNRPAERKVAIAPTRGCALVGNQWKILSAVLHHAYYYLYQFKISKCVSSLIKKLTHHYRTINMYLCVRFVSGRLVYSRL